MMAKKRQKPRVLSEDSPLLGAESPFSPPEPMAPPPPYSEILGDLEAAGPSTDFVKCDVCNYMITKSTAKNKRVITCPRCNEATALRDPEKGKRYLRCPECNCLLIFNDSDSKITCPRERCKIKIDVKSGKPLQKRDPVANPSSAGNINQEPQYCITCGHCRRSFVQAELPTRQIRCPICQKKSNIGESSGRRSAVFYFGLGLLCNVTCLVLMTSTMGYRHNAGYWYIYLILLAGAIIFIVLGLWSLFVKKSTLQVAATPPV